jgi:hypothetical protein
MTQNATVTGLLRVLMHTKCHLGEEVLISYSSLHTSKVVSCKVDLYFGTFSFDIFSKYTLFWQSCWIGTPKILHMYFIEARVLNVTCARVKSCYVFDRYYDVCKWLRFQESLHIECHFFRSSVHFYVDGCCRYQTRPVNTPLIYRVPFH